VKLIFGLLLAVRFLLGETALAVVNATEVVFTARDIQAVIEKAPRSKSMVNGLFLVSLEDSPVFKLGDPPNRFSVSARLAIQFAGSKPVSARISGSANIIYDESRKAFFLDSPVVESVEAPFIPTALESASKAVITDQLVKRFGTTPLYTLRGDRSMKERAAWTSLKSIQISKDAVLAYFALQ